MLKVYLVDDEPWIVTLLESLINWNKEGLQIIGRAHDGESALKEIRYLKPHIVLTDIRMPVMNGLQLIEEGRTLADPPRFVILTGHSEFQYARDALRQGVFDYLLKPVEEEALLDVLSRLKKKIGTESKEEVRRQDERRRVELLTRMLDGSGTDDGGRDAAGNSDDKIIADDEERDPVRKAVSIMENEYGRDLSLTDIAARVFLSESYFSDLFSKETGRTFKEHLTEIRIEKAKEFLKKPGLKIKDVAGMTGYSNPNYFCKVFRKNTGMSPKEYIRSL